MRRREDLSWECWPTCESTQRLLAEGNEVSQPLAATEMMIILKESKPQTITLVAQSYWFNIEPIFNQYGIWRISWQRYNDCILTSCQYRKVVYSRYLAIINVVGISAQYSSKLSKRYLFWCRNNVSVISLQYWTNISLISNKQSNWQHTGIICYTCQPNVTNMGLDIAPMPKRVSTYIFVHYWPNDVCY